MLLGPLPTRRTAGRGRATRGDAELGRFTSGIRSDPTRRLRRSRRRGDADEGRHELQVRGRRLAHARPRHSRSSDPIDMAVRPSKRGSVRLGTAGFDVIASTRDDRLRVAAFFAASNSFDLFTTRVHSKLLAGLHRLDAASIWYDGTWLSIALTAQIDPRRPGPHRSPRSSGSRPAACDTRPTATTASG